MDDICPIMLTIMLKTYSLIHLFRFGLLFLAIAWVFPAPSAPQPPINESTSLTLAARDGLDPKKLKLRSQAALVVAQDGRLIYSKSANVPMPIASITKLMTAIVVLEAAAPLKHKITISKADRDLLRLTGSRLEYGKATLTRKELLQIALMSSENRAAAALGRTTFPGGSKAFISAMNRKAKALGMTSSHFADSTGLAAANVSTAKDLVKLIRAASRHKLIRQATTARSKEVRPYRRRGELRYVNTNRLLKNKNWKIGLSKTGYINESGRCLVMQAELHGRKVHIVLLNSFGKLTPFGDSNRLRKWMGRNVTRS